MRTGAIFARGSCRALKWIAVLGALSALGSAQAVAQPTVTAIDAAEFVGAVVTVKVTDAVETDDAHMVTGTPDGSDFAISGTVAESASVSGDEITVTFASADAVAANARLSYTQPDDTRKQITSIATGVALANFTTALAEKDIPPVFTVDMDDVSREVDIEIDPAIELPTAEGGNGDLAYSITGLPAGVEFDDTVDPPTLSGTPTTVGSNTVVYTVADNDTNTAADDSDRMVFQFMVTEAAEPVVPVEVTVKSVSAATSVGEAGGLQVTVTADVPGGTSSIDSKMVMVEIVPSDGNAGAEPDDTTLLGTDGDGYYEWKKVPRTEKASTATFKFRVAIGQDLDAEDEKFKVEVEIDGDGMQSKEITINDAQDQKFSLSLPAAAKGAITEGADASTLTLKADPVKTFDIPVTLALNPNDPLKYTLGDLSADMFGISSVTATIAAKADGDREEDTITVAAYTTGTLGNDQKIAELEITVEDADALPEVTATAIVLDEEGDPMDPQPDMVESIEEGEMIDLKITVVDKDGKAMKAAEDLMVSLMPTGDADQQDYRLSMHPIAIDEGADSATIVLTAVMDQDIGMETLMFDAVVSGDAKIGPETRASMGVLNLAIVDATEKLVEAKSDTELMPIIYGAIDDGDGDDDMFSPGEMIELDASMLFTVRDGYSLGYAASSDMTDVAGASSSGSMVTVMAMMEGGPADITITATANSMMSGVTRLEQTSPNVARVSFPVTVALDALSVTVAADPMEIMEGGMSTITATASRMVAASDGDVEITLDVVGDGMLSADSIMIAAGMMSGSVTLTATEDDDDYMDETVTVVAAGDGIMGSTQIAIAVTDNDEAPVDEPTVSAKTQEQVDAVFATAIADARTGSDWVEGGAAAMVDMSMLFNVAEGAMPAYSGVSSDEMVVSATSSGMMLTLMPMSDGMATITVTAAAGDDVASAMSDVMVADLPFMVEMVSASAAMVDEGMSITITATANKMVEGENVEVMLMRDGASTASMDDYSLDPPLITIMVGDDMGALTLMATDDVYVEGMERLTLAAMMGDMNVGMVMIEIADNDMESTFTLSGPEDMNLVEGESYELTVMADPAVPMDTEVMIMRDRSMSDADDADFTAEPVMIMAGETMGTTMLMVTEDGMDDAGHGMPEMLVVFGMVDGMETNSLTFYTWDMAVPALPLIAQLLLAAFLAIGGYRRYLRR